MSLLNNLREQALQKQAAERDEAEKQAALEAFYISDIQPRLIKLYQNLHELTHHLNYLQQELWVRYPLSAKGHKVDMLQQNYQMEIDSGTYTQNITFYAMCRGKLDLNFGASDPKEVDKHLEYLKNYNLKYQFRPHKNEFQQLLGADFTVKTEVPIRLNFKADIPSKCIRLTITNLPVLGQRVLTVLPHNIDDQFFDDLGRFVLREKDDLLKLEISEAERRLIQERLLIEKKLREEELRRAEQENIDKFG